MLRLVDCLYSFGPSTSQYQQRSEGMLLDIPPPHVVRNSCSYLSGLEQSFSEPFVTVHIVAANNQPCLRD